MYDYRMDNRQTYCIEDINKNLTNLKSLIEVSDYEIFQIDIFYQREYNQITTPNSCKYLHNLSIISIIFITSYSKIVIPFEQKYNISLIRLVFIFQIKIQHLVYLTKEKQ